MARRFATIVCVRAPRRLAPLVALAAALLAAAPAGATDHTMRIDEVQLSAGGDPTAQFVELRDSSDEPFPSPPYRLVVFDAAGTRLGAHEIGNALAGVDATQPFTLASATSGIAGDQILGIALPAGAGRLCFTRGADEQVIQCVAYGCATAGSVVAPPDGQSLQRQGSGSFALAVPTPEAANSAGTAATCPATGGGGTGTPGGGTGSTGGGTGGGTGDTTGGGTGPGTVPGTTLAAQAPVLTVARRLRLGRLRITVRPRAAGRVRARATVRRGGRAMTIAEGRRAISGTRALGLTLRPTRRGRSVAARALRRTGRAAATLVLTFTNSRGQRTTVRRRFTLLR